MLKNNEHFSREILHFGQYSQNSVITTVSINLPRTSSVPAINLMLMGSSATGGHYGSGCRGCLARTQHFSLPFRVWQPWRMIDSFPLNAVSLVPG